MRVMLCWSQAICSPQLTRDPEDRDCGTSSGITSQPVTWEPRGDESDTLSVPQEASGSIDQTRTQPSSLPTIRLADAWLLHVTRLLMWDTRGFPLLHKTCEESLKIRTV